MNEESGAYARAGVDPEKVRPFIEIMKEVSRATIPIARKRRDVEVIPNIPNPHGAVWCYVGIHQGNFFENGTDEILGHLSLIAEIMYRATGKSYHDRVARAAGLIIALDVIAHGGMPFVWLDSIQASSSDWFKDPRRAADYARGCRELCEEIGCALPAGESGSMRYLVRPPEELASAAAAFSGAMVGIIAPRNRLIVGARQPGHRILGVASTGPHANGASLLIDRALKLSHGFLTQVPGGNTFGDEVLAPMRSYVQLVERLLSRGIPVAEILPGTGDGVAKLGVDKHPYSYAIERWIPDEEVPRVFKFIRDPDGLNVSARDYWTTFNAGIGLYLFAESYFVPAIQRAGLEVGYQVYDLGEVRAGDRTITLEFEHGLALRAPGG